jgi:hypothetical protein
MPLPMAGASGHSVQDLFAAYIEVVMGSSGALPPVPQTYSEWGATERAFWKSEVLEERTEFWKTRLTGLPIGNGICPSRRVRPNDGYLEIPEKFD